ncbi:MAG: PglZ domain-containing protein [Clostridia bacterium]
MRTTKNNKKFKFYVSVILIATLVLTCFSACKVEKSTRSLIVSGDVENEVTITSTDGFKTQKIKIKDASYDGILASDLIAKAGVYGDGSVILHGADGVMAEIPLSQLDNTCFLAMTENGWQFNGETLPKQTRIKNIDKIIVKSNEILEKQRCFRTIHEDLGKTYSFGELFLKEKEVHSVLEGQPKLNGKTANSMTKRELISLETLFGELSQGDFENAVGYFEDGSEKSLDGGYIEVRGNSVDYIGDDKKTRVENLLGVWFDPPQSVANLNDYILKEIPTKKVMLIELDGLGFYSLIENQKISSKYQIDKMRTVAPSISNVALATILTGKSPFETGILSRKDRTLKCDDIFVSLNKLGKTSVVVEGDSKLINLSIDQILNIDQNGNGTNDDEVFESGMKNCDNDFVFIHFHGFDDVAHNDAPSSNIAKAKIETLWEYVEKLAENFDGSVIVTADHGQRDTPNSDKKGTHGEFFPRDMTIPFVIVK